MIIEIQLVGPRRKLQNLVMLCKSVHELEVEETSSGCACRCDTGGAHVESNGIESGTINHGSRDISCENHGFGRYTAMPVENYSRRRRDWTRR